MRNDEMMKNLSKFVLKEGKIKTVYILMALFMIMLYGCRNHTDNQDRLIFSEDFSDGMDNWWVEGGRKVWVDQERLYVDANPPEGGVEAGRVATIWYKNPIRGDVRIEMKAHVIDSRSGGNNINTFLFFSDPDGRPLYESREERANADYGYYHNLDGYIVTFLNQREDDELLARIRLRRCPGFQLIDEAIHPMGVHAGQTYHFVFTRLGNTLTLEVNGIEVGEMEDENRHEEGLLGLRTFGTYLWWDDIRVYDISE